MLSGGIATPVKIVQTDLYPAVHRTSGIGLQLKLGVIQTLRWVHGTSYTILSDDAKTRMYWLPVVKIKLSFSDIRALRIVSLFGLLQLGGLSAV